MCLHARRRGLSLAYALVFMTTAIAIASLAVDVGRAQLAKTQLRTAADAAARYGVTGLSDNTAVAKAIAAAVDNKVDGVPLALQTGDVTIGTWSTVSRTFTPGGSSPNSVRIIANRSAARGNALPLIFGRVLGTTGCDLHATAIAAVPDVLFGIVGLNSVSMGGNTSTSYWSSSGVVTAGPYGSVASNGAIALSGNTYINGDARPGAGQSVTGAAGRVLGSTTPLTNPLSFPNGSAGTFATVNDNLQIAQITGARDLKVSSGVANIPAGTYYVHDMDVGANGALNITGKATFYVYHNVKFDGSATTLGNLPKNLNIILVPDVNGAAPGTVNVSSSSSLYATIYAPQSPVTLNGSGDIYGSILGKSINMTGSSGIHYDLSLSGSTGVVQMVK